MKISHLFFVVVILALLSSCRNSTSKDTVLTKRIQYDVNIENADADMEWWVQNIEGASREKFIKLLLLQATEGKVKAYDFFSYKLLTTNDVKSILKTVDTISVERDVPPYDLVDTVVVKEVRLADIKKIRFLEEWHINESSLAVTKTVLGLCPMVIRLDEAGEVRGNKPLFWVFLDKRYPDEFLISK